MSLIVNGMEVIISPYLDRWVWVQTRFPRSRKRRIQRKWTKDRRNWERRLAGLGWFEMFDRLYVGPENFKVLLADLEDTHA